jgi:hypothetical protein
MANHKRFKPDYDASLLLQLLKAFKIENYQDAFFEVHYTLCLFLLSYGPQEMEFAIWVEPNWWVMKLTDNGFLFRLVPKGLETEIPSKSYLMRRMITIGGMRS